MKNTTNDIYEDYEAWLSVCPHDDYPEEEVPYSCSEEAEAFERQQAALDSINQYSKNIIQQ